MSGQGGRYVAGLIGSDIGSSLSPPLHEREATELGLCHIYQLIDLDDQDRDPEVLGELVKHARQLGFRGLNITHPCKQSVLPYLDELSADASMLGAVNTVVFTGDRAIGHNTDGFGFAEGFARGLPGASLREVVLLGAGGAGSAVAHAVLRLGAKRLTVIDVEPARAQRLAAAFGDPSASEPARGEVVADTVENLAARLAPADGLINATPVGMESHPGLPLPAELLRSELWVADVIYRPLETELLRHARELGCRTLHGGGMVVFQAAEALRLFTGREPDGERMSRHFAALTSAAVEH